MFPVGTVNLAIASGIITHRLAKANFTPMFSQCHVLSLEAAQDMALMGEPMSRVSFQN